MTAVDVTDPLRLEKKNYVNCVSVEKVAQTTLSCPSVCILACTGVGRLSHLLPSSLRDLGALTNTVRDNRKTDQLSICNPTYQQSTLLQLVSQRQSWRYKTHFELSFFVFLKFKLELLHFATRYSRSSSSYSPSLWSRPNQLLKTVSEFIWQNNSVSLHQMKFFLFSN